MKEKLECTFWSTKERKPIVQDGSVDLGEGKEIKFKSKNEFKAWRKKVKADIKRLRKAGK